MEIENRINFFENLFQLLVTEEYICSYVFPLCKEDPSVRDIWGSDTNSYVNRVLSDKPEAIKEDDFIDKLYENGGLDDKTYNVLQISDWHIDLEYVEGTAKEC